VQRVEFGDGVRRRRRGRGRGRRLGRLELYRDAAVHERLDDRFQNALGLRRDRVDEVDHVGLRVDRDRRDVFDGLALLRDRALHQRHPSQQTEHGVRLRARECCWSRVSTGCNKGKGIRQAG